MRQVTRHSERWDLGRCSPPARLAWTARRAAWSATQAALDAKDAGGALLARKDVLHLMCKGLGRRACTLVAGTAQPWMPRTLAVRCMR